MTRAVRQVQILNEGLIRADVGRGFQLLSERKLRKPKECSDCGERMPTGAKAFGDVTSCAMNRMDRYCLACVGMAKMPTLVQCEQAIGEEAIKWAGRCFEIATAIINAKLVRGTAVYGHFLGEVHSQSHFGARAKLGFQRHGWIVLKNGSIFDPTRWAFEARDPYLYIGQASSEYDEGGNKVRTRSQPTPEYNDCEEHFEFTSTNLPSAPWAHVEKLLRPDYSEQEPGLLCLSQVAWLAHADFAVLQPHAEAIYAAIESVGRGVLIPIDNRVRAKRT